MQICFQQELLKHFFQNPKTSFHLGLFTWLLKLHNAKQEKSSAHLFAFVAPSIEAIGYSFYH